MKLRLELEVSPEEAARVAPLLTAFKELADSLSKAPPSPQSPRQKSKPASPRAKPRSPEDALLSVSISEKTPSEAAQQISAGGFSQAEIADAAISILIDPAHAGSSSTRASALVATVEKCGDGVMKVFKQSFVGRSVRELVQPRNYNCARSEFIGFGEGLIALAGIGQVSKDAVMRTIRRLLSDDSCWAAGVTVLCLLLERGRVTGEIMEIKERLEDVARVADFRYDVEYINSVTGWGIGQR